MDTIEIGGRVVMETAESLKTRLDVSEYYLYLAQNERGMPIPIKIGVRRFFDRKKVDAWLLTQVYQARSIHNEKLVRSGRMLPTELPIEA